MNGLQNACAVRRGIFPALALLGLSLELACGQTDPLDNWHGPADFPGSFGTVNGIAYGNGTFIAVGNNGALALSPNGSNWTQYLSPPLVNYGGVIYGGGYFFAYGSVSGTSTNYILQSLDGLSWNKIYQPGTSLIKAAAYGNGRVVFVATDRIITTTFPATNWNEYLIPNASASVITFGMGRFVVGRFSSLPTSTYFLSSADGITWRYDYGPSAEAPSVPGIAYGNGIFVAPWRTNGTSNAGFLISTNLISWNYTPLPDVTSVGTIAFGGGQFISYVINQVLGVAVVVTSSNGMDWVYRTNAPTVTPYTYGQGKFLAGTRWQSDIFTDSTSVPPSNLALAMFPGVTITGTEGLTYRIEATTNLAPASVWQTLTNFTLPYSPYLWIDTAAPGQSRKFYRAVQLE